MLHPAGLSSQPHQGVGARLFRRFGGAVRRAVTGITRTGRARRPVAPPPSPSPQAAGDPQPTTPPRPPRAPRRPRTAPLAPSPQPAQPGWIARWFGRKRRRPAPSGIASSREASDAPFTPEAYPELSPAFCAILNTPVEDCDPEILRLMLCALAELLASELGLPDAKAVFAELWDRLGAPLDQTAPDAAPDAAPEAATIAVPDAPPEPPAEPPAAAQPDRAALATTAPQPPPRASLPPRSAPRRHQSLRRDADRPVRHHLAGCVMRKPRQALLPRRLCYAARASPP